MVTAQGTMKWFVHYSAIDSSGFRELSEDQKVTYEVPHCGCESEQPQRGTNVSEDGSPHLVKRIRRVTGIASRHATTPEANSSG
ncbi:cold shock domain-containing protein [Saccharopolyspora sp. NPDC002686]|uniref:cold-shock protein n=1 Tax=Saccharopolyspora sp. NPDC002686 TaxID=3154541 RepID=UPI003331A224